MCVDGVLILCFRLNVGVICLVFVDLKLVVAGLTLLPCLNVCLLIDLGFDWVRVMLLLC